MHAIADNMTNISNSAVSLENSSILDASDKIIFPNDTIEGSNVRYGYKIANMHFLVPEGVISELIQSPDIFYLPNAPLWVKGLINIRGNIIPVMNLEKLVKSTVNNEYTDILVFNKHDSEFAIAILIDGIPVLLEQNDELAMANNYPEVLLDFISSGFKLNNTNWIEFNPQKLFVEMAYKIEE